MNKRNLSLLIVAILILSLAGCGSSKSSSNTSNNTTAPAVDTSTITKTFTLEELAKNDGKNGNPGYVAISGVVYDVTNIKDWKNGQHQGLSAGKDLTTEIEKAPHGMSVLKDLTIIGKLA